MAAVTVAVVAAIVRWRREAEYGAVLWSSFAQFRADPWQIGATLQAALPVLVLGFVITRTSTFQRFVTRRGTQRDGLFVVGMLTGLHVVGYGVFAGSESNEVVAVVLASVFSGLVGGWLVGGALGLLDLLAVSPIEVALYGGFEGRPGPVAWLTAASDLHNIPLLWLGLAAGVAGTALGRRRFRAPWALAVALGGTLLTLAFYAGMEADPAWVIELAAPVSLVAGLCAGALGLLVEDALTDDARRRAAEAELARTQAENRALRAQINPHFLFNSLNTIRYFVRTDPPRARRLLADLSEIFQQALRSGEVVALKEEFRYVEAYLALEQARLGERLQVEWDVPDDALLDTLVPTLVLQPLVENAVIHGISPSPEGGTVRIAVGQEGDVLVARIADNGVGMSADLIEQVTRPSPGRAGGRAEARGTGAAAGPSGPSRPSGGPSAGTSGATIGRVAESSTGRVPGRSRPSIGLANVRERLDALSGDGAGLEVLASPGQGTTIVVRVPLRWDNGKGATGAPPKGRQPSPGDDPSVHPAAEPPPMSEGAES